MLPFKKILCPTDFSEPSYEALKVAGELASHFKSQLCVVHVVSLTPMVTSPMLPTTFDVAAYQKELESAAAEQLKEVMDKYLPGDLKTCVPIVTSGYAPDEIIRVAGERNNDLIVISTRGLTGLKRVFLGSVAERVVRLAPCPVLSIGPGKAAL